MPETADLLGAVMSARRSVRSFLPDTINDDTIRRLISAASQAPSGSNAQNWHFVAVRDPRVRASMLAAVDARVAAASAAIPSARGRSEFVRYARYYRVFETAPLVIAAVRLPYESLTGRILRRYDLTDGVLSEAGIQGLAAAVENLLLMAHALGLGACWLTGPLIARKELEEILFIAGSETLQALIAVGRPAEVPPAPARRPVAEILTIIG